MFTGPGLVFEAPLGRRPLQSSNSATSKNPGEVAFGDGVVVLADGSIESRNETGEWLIDPLRLDEELVTQYRQRWLETRRALISSGHLAPYAEWMRYPDNLPNLEGKKPPSNRCPAGISQSAFELRKRGALPETD